MGQGVVVSLALALVAGAPAETPRAIIQDSVTRVMVMLRDAELNRPEAGEGIGRTSPGNGRAEIRRVAAELFDFEEVSRRALGRHWSGRTAAERAEFVSVFTDLLARTYIGKIEGYAGARMSFLGETVDGPYAVVRSRIMSPREGETTLDYQLHRKAGRWKVYDVLVDGVSFVSNYRSQFDRFITRSSYTALVDQLRRKEAWVAAPAASRASPPPTRR